MSDHAKFAALANRLIARHGRLVTFKRISPVPSDVNRPWLGTETAPETFGPYFAVFVPFRGFEFGSEFTDTKLFKEVELICLVSGSQADLETCHTLVDSTRDYKIEWGQRLRPGDQTIVYAFGVN